MYEALNEKLLAVREGIREREVLRERLGKTRSMLAFQRERLSGLERALKREGADVERLEGFSLSGFFHSMIGRRDEWVEKERREFVEARLRHGECFDAVEALAAEEAELVRRLEGFGDLDERYKGLMAEKESAVAGSGGAAAGRMVALSEALADAQSTVKEVKEALSAGRLVLGDLGETVRLLGSARNWGLWDTLGGGGLISTAIKHGKLDEARRTVHRAQQHLRILERELSDVDMRLDESLEIGSFAKFADFFFDGLVADIFVQSKIGRSLEAAEACRSRVERVVLRLEGRVVELEEKARAVRLERQALIEEA
ncbi:MAG: hypothetical protein GXY33_09405 [Phycisphaerae bacterium]|nr:hypothetical protein [Phycisphaerae bacterium]